MLRGGLSSSLFLLVPKWYNVPNIVQYRMNTLALCSGMYHLHEDHRQIEKKNKNMITRILECLDGMAIILCCGRYWIDIRGVVGLMQMYASMKMVSNDDTIKRLVYLSTLIKSSYDNPRVILPISVSLIGLRSYFENNEEWNICNRTIWHLGNSIFIGMSYAVK
jgi:hypothetical protein